MTAELHPMTHHDTMTPLQYGEDTLRAEAQAGLKIERKHFINLLTLVREQAERQAKEKTP